MDSLPLAERVCPDCQGISLLSKDEIESLLAQLHDWQIEGSHISRTFAFKNFRQALNLANQIGDLADNMDHHPQLIVAWGSLQVEIWTHTVNGLTELDFILAAKIDRLV